MNRHVHVRRTATAAQGAPWSDTVFLMLGNEGSRAQTPNLSPVLNSLYMNAKPPNLNL